MQMEEIFETRGQEYEESINSNKEFMLSNQKHRITIHKRGSWLRESEIVDGKIHGISRSVFQSKDIIQNTYEDDVKTGEGFEIWTDPTPDILYGEWKFN